MRWFSRSSITRSWRRSRSYSFFSKRSCMLKQTLNNLKSRGFRPRRRGKRRRGYLHRGAVWHQWLRISHNNHKPCIAPSRSRYLSSMTSWAIFLRSRGTRHTVEGKETTVALLLSEKSLKTCGPSAMQKWTARFRKSWRSVISLTQSSWRRGIENARS